MDDILKWHIVTQIDSERHITLISPSKYFQHHEPVNFKNKFFANVLYESQLIIVCVNWTELCVKNKSIYCNNILKNLI